MNTNNYEQFDKQLIEQIVTAQNAKRKALQEHRLEMYPWILKAREIQKKLMENGEY